MKTKVTFDVFINAFRRLDRLKNFSLPGSLEALFDHLEAMEDETGQEIELDVIALCCEFSEFASAKDAAREYGIISETEEEALEKIKEKTRVILLDGGIILQRF